jgi:hypothetical protein
MSHVNTLQNGIYTSLCFVASAGAITTMDTAAELVTLFASGGVEITGIRDFPEFGNPSNIVNIPTYGSPSSTQIGGQSDLNTLEFTLNYVPDSFETSITHARVGDGLLYPFQIALCSKKPANFKQIATTGISTGTTLNTVFNFAGKFESLSVMPSLTDSITAKMTLSMATQLFGPVTYA